MLCVVTLFELLCNIPLCDYTTIYLFELFDPALPLLGIYPIAVPTGEHKDGCVRMRPACILPLPFLLPGQPFPTRMELELIYYP